MKNARLMPLLLILAFTRGAGAALAEEQLSSQSGDFSYILLEDGTADITRYFGKETNLVKQRGRISLFSNGHSVSR